MAALKPVLFLCVAAWYLLAAAPPSSCLPGSSKAERLTQWVLEQGMGPTPLKVALVEYEGGKRMAMEATEDVGPEEVILEVPENLVLKYTFLKKEFPALDFSNITTTSSATAVYLLYQKSLGEDSFWSPWLDILPTAQDYLTLPYFWSDETKKYFEQAHTTDIYRLWPGEREKHAQEALLLCTRLQEHAVPDLDCALESVKWALCVVTSRSWGIQGTAEQSGEVGEVMVPFADMFNHMLSGAGFDFQAGRKVVTQRGTQYSQGDEVYLSYGPKASSRVGLTYGFLPPEFEWALEIERTFVERTLFDFSKRELLNKFGCKNNTKFFLRYKDSSIVSQLISCVRLDNLSPSDLTSILKNSNGSLQVSSFITLENERLTLGRLYTNLKAVRDAYTTTVEQDEQMLQRKLTADMRLAVNIRRHEKLVYDWILEEIRQHWIQLLDISEFLPK